MEESTDLSVSGQGQGPGSLPMDSLPEAVESVAQAQKQQASEIEQHQLLFTKLKEQLVKEKTKEETLKEELRTCLRKICLYQEDAAKKKIHCAELQEAIHDVVLANASLKLKLERVVMESGKDEKLFQRYREKMRSCVESAREMEADSPEHIELARQRGAVEELERKRDELKAELVTDEESGELRAKTALEEDTHQLQIARAELQQRHHQMEQEVSNELSKQASIKQDIEVLQKRNQAQLTRLKCQLKEAQLRNWQWSQEAGQLETQLQSLTGRSRQSQDGDYQNV